MPGYEFWKWADPDDLHKQQAQDLVQDAQKMREQADQDELHQHVGGIIENFQADIARRMEPLTSKFNSYAAPPPAPEAPAPSMVDDVMSRFSKGAQSVGSAISRASDSAREAIKPIVDPALDLVGTNKLVHDRNRADEISETALSTGHQLGAESPSFRRDQPELGHEYDAVTNAQIAASAIGAGGGVVEGSLNAAGKFAKAATGPLGQRVAGDAFRSAKVAINGVMHSDAPPLIMSAAEKKIAGTMGSATMKSDIGTHLNGVQYQLFDDLDHVGTLMADREKALGRKLTDNENAYEIARLGRASREIADEWYTTHVGDALSNLPNISGSAAQGEADLNNYLRAKDAIGKATAKGNPDRLFGGRTAADMQEGLDEMQKRLGADGFAQLEASAQKFYDLGDFLLDRKVQAGLVGAEQAQHLKDLYPNHMPIQTIDWLEDKLSNTSSRMGKAGGAANDIKELTEFGTDRGAELPIEAFRRAADRTAVLSAKNEAGSAIIAAARDVDWAQGLIRPADNASAKLSGLKTTAGDAYKRLPGETVQTFRVNGDVASFYVDKSLKPLFDYSVSVGDGAFMNVLQKSADMTRKLAIGYNPYWGVYQLAKDSLTVLAKNGGLRHPIEMGRNIKRLGVAADEVGLSPFESRATGAVGGAVAGSLAPDYDGDTTLTDRLRNAAIGAGVGASLKSTGLGQRAGRGALRSEARIAGALPGAVDHISGEAGSYGANVRAHIGTDVNGPADFARKVTKAMLDGVQGFNEKLDAIPRLAEYQGRKAAGASTQKAALAARDVTIDPSRGGAWTRKVNATVPFFNVAFQSAAYAPRLIFNKDQKVRERAMSGIASSVIMPTIALEAYNQQDPRYKDVPDYDKDRGFILMTPGKGQIDPATGREKPTYLTVRTDAFTPFVVLARALYNATPVGQGVDAAKTSGALIRSASPIDFSPITDTMMGHGDFTDLGKAAASTALKYIPPVPRIIGEAIGNKDTFRNRPIIPQGLENQPIENQYTQDTSETAKLLGPKLGIAPALMDHLLKAWGGGADAIVSGADAGLSATGIAGAGDSQRVEKLRRDLAKTGTSDEDAARIQGEIDRELAIKTDRDASVRNVPLVGGLGSRYYREGGSQTLDDREAALEKSLLEKKRDTGPVGADVKRFNLDIGDVKDEITGIKLTRQMGVDYREKALSYRTKLLDDLVKTPMYKGSDDVEKTRLMKSAMQQAAGWAAYDSSEANPAIRASLEAKAPVGGAFVTPQIDKNVEVASRRYLGALKAQQDLDDIRGNERFTNVAPKDVEQVASDRATLSRYKSLMDDTEAEMAFEAKYGATRLYRAQSAKESKYWSSRLDAFRRDNPDYGLFIESAPQTFTRKGLDAKTVARMAGL